MENGRVVELHLAEFELGQTSEAADPPRLGA